MTIKRPALRTLTSKLMTLSVVTVALAVGLAACGTTGDGGRSGRAKIDPKLGVAPSPRVVADGKPVPKGGGRSLVGNPYTVAGKRYVPRVDPSYKAVGLASWYGSDFHGRRTANGEVFDRYSISAAHPTMPLPSYARVTSLTTGRSIIVRVNDRGPYHSNRILDMSQRAAEMLDVKRAGIAKIKVEYVGPAPVEGDDTRYLMASYRGPHDQPDSGSNIMMAAVEAIPGVSTLVNVFDSSDSQPEKPAPVVVAARSVAPPAPAAARVDGTETAQDLLRAPKAPPIAVVPPVRPVETFDYVTIASTDPGELFVGSQPVAVAALAQPAPATSQPLGYTPTAAPVSAAPTVMFGDTVLPPLPPQASGYAEERVSQAYAAVSGVDAGTGLSDLVAKLEARATPSAAAGNSDAIQVGVFSNADNATRLSSQLLAYGLPVVEDVTVNGKAMKRVRLTMLAVPADTALSAITSLGVNGARVLR